MEARLAPPPGRPTRSDRGRRLRRIGTPVRWAFLLFLLACAVRIGLLLRGAVPREWLLPETWSELGRTAKSLAESGRYADGYLLPSGPTAHPAPIWTGFLALLYRLFGFTLAAGIVRALAGIASFAAVAALLPWVAARTGLGWRAGALAGAVAALVPWLGANEVAGWSAYEPLAAAALAALAVGMHGRWGRDPPAFAASLALGLAWGASFHLMPQLAAVLAVYLVFELARRGLRSGARPVATLLLGAALACLPWQIRNVRALGGPVFVRSNFGLELRLGNHDGAAADFDTLDRREGDAMRHPGGNAAEARRVAELGELEYMRRARREAFEWIADHPADFARLAGQRFLRFWLGPLDGSPRAVAGVLLALLAVAGAVRVVPRLPPPGRAALLLPLVGYPLVHYVVTYMPSYAYPVHWILLLLAAALFVPNSTEVTAVPPESRIAATMPLPRSRVGARRSRLGGRRIT